MSKPAAHSPKLQYARDIAGSMMIVTSMAVLLLLAVTSLVLDYVHKSTAENQLQKIADSAVQAAVSPANLPADTKQAELRRREIVTNYLRNSGSDLSDARLVGTPDISMSSNGVSVTLQAQFKGSWGAVLEMVGSKPSQEPYLAVHSEAQW